MTKVKGKKRREKDLKTPIDIIELNFIVYFIVWFKNKFLFLKTKKPFFFNIV